MVCSHFNRDVAKIGFIKCECMSRSSMNFFFFVNSVDLSAFLGCSPKRTVLSVASLFPEVIKRDASAVLYLYQVVRNYAEIWEFFGLPLSIIQSLLIPSDFKHLSRQMYKSYCDFLEFEIVTTKLMTCGVALSNRQNWVK